MGEEEQEAGTSTNLPREEVEQGVEDHQEAAAGIAVESTDKIQPPENHDKTEANGENIDEIGMGPDSFRSPTDDADREKSKDEAERGDGKASVEFAPLVLTGDEEKPVEVLKDGTDERDSSLSNHDEVSGRASIDDDAIEQIGGKGEKKNVKNSTAIEEENRDDGEGIFTPPREGGEKEAAISVGDTATAEASDLAPVDLNNKSTDENSKVDGIEVSTSGADIDAEIPAIAANADASAASFDLTQAVSAVSADEAAVALQEGLAEGTTSDALQETAEAMALPEQEMNSEMTSLFGEDNGDIEFMLEMNELEKNEDTKKGEVVVEAGNSINIDDSAVSFAEAAPDAVKEATDAASKEVLQSESNDKAAEPVNAAGENETNVSQAATSGSVNATLPTAPRDGEIISSDPSKETSEAKPVGEASAAASIDNAEKAKSVGGEATVSSNNAVQSTSTETSASTALENGVSVSITGTTPSAAVTATPLSPAKALTSSPMDEHVLKQIALVLKINKELIRLCVDLQTKDLSSDLLFKDAAIRLQSNLAFLASIADKSTKGFGGLKEPRGAPLLDEPFPPTLHAPESQLPKLYHLLRLLGISRNDDRQQQSQSTTASPKPTMNNSGNKRERAQSQEGKRKRQKELSGSEGQATPSPRSASMLPPHQQRMQSPMGFPKGASSTMATASPSQLTPPRNSFDASNGMQAQQQQQIQPGVAQPVMNGVNNTPPQAQNLTQAFGPNAINNLQALQTHYRGQQQAIVAYMEANIAGFRNLPIQMQLQHMSNVQNAAMQRQRQSTNPTQNPNQVQNVNQNQTQNQNQGQSAFQMQQAHLRRTSAAQSPGSDSPGGMMSARRTQSPMPISAASPNGTSLQQQQQAAGGRPVTPASSQQNNMFGQMGSPAASQAMSTGVPLSSPQQSVAAASYALPSAAQSMMANMPPHLQQQFFQQLQHQQQQQQFYQQQQQPPQMLPQNQMNYNPSAIFAPPPQMQPNGTMWSPNQQQPPSG